MKKVLSLIMSLCAIISLSVPALAADSQDSSYTVTVNEYDVYVAIRSANTAELVESGISVDQATMIKSNAIEDALLELSGCSTDELELLGYTSSEIALLHKYSGERIEDAPELRGVFADMTATFYRIGASKVSITVAVDWAWSNAPFFASDDIIDIMAMRWKGTNLAGSPMNLALNSSYSSCSVDYYDRSGNYQYTRSGGVLSEAPYDHAYATFAMGSLDGDAIFKYYAKEGTLRIRVDRVGTDYIQEAAFVFAYGHSSLTLTPSLSLPASFSIGFDFGTEKMIEKAIRISNTGDITEY